MSALFSQCWDCFLIVRFMRAGLWSQHLDVSILNWSLRPVFSAFIIYKQGIFSVSLSTKNHMTLQKLLGGMKVKKQHWKKGKHKNVHYLMTKELWLQYNPWPECVKTVFKSIINLFQTSERLLNLLCHIDDITNVHFFITAVFFKSLKWFQCRLRGVDTTIIKASTLASKREIE